MSKLAEPTSKDLQIYLATQYPTLRDQMALAALSGLLAKLQPRRELSAKDLSVRADSFQEAVKEAYDIAELMLKQRDRVDAKPSPTQN